MRHILFGVLFSLVTALPAFAAGSGAELSLKGEQVFLLKGGQSTALDPNMYPAQPVGGADMRFVCIDPDYAEEQGLEPGLYIFKGDGKPFVFAAIDYAEICSDVRLSPNGKVLAVDAGMMLVRDWHFFSFPEMKLIGETGYYLPTIEAPAIVWVGEKGVLVSSMELEEHGRTCPGDPCGPVSVDYYDIGAHKTTKLLTGTDVCDYVLTGLKGDGLTVTAAEMCLPSPKDWYWPDGTPPKAVTATLP